ncbi:HD-GYP domain-containing protein (c-di-GMP phosphodiesterase class II) [Salsuginibacillus halophilus]|uniref:HD-GYP domain-containing protein (C-di-GMP phosphodiesterase class II) n=1 Tax=Salsuginibacillus halophilus TaxID=517424 RepID=A0A2P8HIA3_9BACI|nr:HD-GYP domain-containing protein [Salsuginibacillus halophilus]PSL45949.1 HD-GYP domain-containing protein (c-di-GMP phosphodiesterase class II) [Salsuginibacillus halophilus]
MLTVKPKQLETGCILARDVMAVTNYPIIRKNTVIKDDHLDLLEAFLIEEVYAERTKVDGTTFQPAEVPEEDDAPQSKDHAFIEQYLQGVQTYKKHFNSWLQGANVDVNAIRQMMQPLLEGIVEEPRRALFIHHYCAKEDYIYHHAVATGLFSAFLGRRLKQSPDVWMQLGVAGALCDSGMSQIDANIFNKQGPLTETEFQNVQKHPSHSYNMLRNTQAFDAQFLLGIVQHHEREDGSGYPMGVKSDKIHLYSRIFAVADVFHALTSERPYREKQSPYRALHMIANEQFGKFHPSVVHALVDSLITFSIGSTVRLTNGEEAEVLFVDSSHPAKPTVKMKQTEKVLDLKFENNLFITELVAE